MTESCDEFDHPVFKNDPIKLKHLVQKHIEVKTLNQQTFSGTVYTIDPVSESIVLLNMESGKVVMNIIMGHAVKDIQLKTEPSRVIGVDVFQSNSFSLKHADVEEKRHKLKDWLLKNRIPVEEEGEVLRIMDAMTIVPPYGIEQCQSNNEVILGRIQALVATLPV